MLPCLPPGDLPNPGIEPRSSALRVDSLPCEPPGKPKTTRVGSLFLLQGIFPTQESNQGLLHCRRILYQLSYQGNPYKSIFLCKKKKKKPSWNFRKNLKYFGLSWAYFISTKRPKWARTWKQPRCLSADEWVRKLGYIYTMEYYSAIKKNTFESVLIRWMKLEPIIQSEVSQKEKYQYIYMEFRKMTLHARQQKRHKEQTFGLCRRRQGWDDLRE